MFADFVFIVVSGFRFWSSGIEVLGLGVRRVGSNKGKCKTRLDDCKLSGFPS